MMRASTIMAALVIAASVATAQNPPAKKQSAPTKQPPATKQAAPKQQPAAKTPAQPSKTAAKTNADASKGAKGAATGAKTPATAQDTAGPPPTIYREEFVYTSGGRRDPFNSLLTTNELRPTISDLKITGILYDPSGRRSIATLRDVLTSALYRVYNGSTLGRMRVAAIRPKIVVFTIDEFGTTRQDSLVYGDTTKARPKS